MKLTKDQARALLADALGVTERKPIPRDLKARALVEVLNGHAASAGVSSLDHDFTKPLPSGSALAELQAHQRGEAVAQQQATSGHVSSEPSDEMQEAVNKAVERALRAHGIGGE